MAEITIFTEQCVGCGLCVRACLSHLIEIDGGKAAVRDAAEKLCIRCGHCVAACPRRLIKIDGEGAGGIADLYAVSPEALARLMKSRRSVRAYKQGAVPGELLRTAFDTVRFAPTGKNKQGVEWIVLNGREKIEAFISVMVEELRTNLKDVPAMDMILADYEAGIDRVFRNAPCAVFNHADTSYDLSVVDCSIAMTYLELLLPGYGVGTTWAGFAIRILQNSPRLREYLGIPEGHMVYAGLFMGMSAENYPNIPPRKQAQVRYL